MLYCGLERVLRYALGEEKVNIDANSACFISPLLIGKFVHERKEYVGDYALFVPESFFSVSANECQSLVKRHLFCSKNGFEVCKIDESRVTSFVHMLDDLHTELTITDNWAKLRIESLINLILTELVRYGKLSEINIAQGLSGAHDIFIRFLKCVEQYFRKCHSVKEYICKLGVSQSKLNESEKNIAVAYQMK